MITKELFGKLECGAEVYAYTVKNSGGAYAKVLNFGGILHQLWMPDRDGKLADVICGFDTVDDYLKDTAYHGSIIGRYGNRIRNGRFTLDGVTYQLALNEKGITHLHGGDEGFNRKMWEVVPYEKVGEQGLILSRISEDGEENYPGTLRTKVTYTLTDENELKIRYEATCDKDTVINMTNHAYFNLNGFNCGTICDQYLTIKADGVCAIDDVLVPTGEIYKVAGTPFDFNTPTKVGARIDDFNDPQLKISGGYDHNYIFTEYDGTLKLQAELYSEESGRNMAIYTDQPCVQLYSGNGISGNIPMKGGYTPIKRTALCLETQHAPDCPNHDNFLSTKLHAGEKYDTTTIYAFTTK